MSDDHLKPKGSESAWCQSILEKMADSMSQYQEDVFLGRRIVAPDSIDVEARVVEDKEQES